MRRIGGALALIIIRDPTLSIRKHKVVQHAAEELKGGHGLVVRSLVSRVVEAGEDEVAVLAHDAVLGAADDEGGVAGAAELGGVGVLDGQRHGLAAEPVADVVGVAVVEGHAHARREQLLDVGEEVVVDQVAGLLEGGEDFVVGFGVVEIDWSRRFGGVSLMPSISLLPFFLFLPRISRGDAFRDYAIKRTSDGVLYPVLIQVTFKVHGRREVRSRLADVVGATV